MTVNSRIAPIRHPDHEAEQTSGAKEGGFAGRRGYHVQNERERGQGHFGQGAERRVRRGGALYRRHVAQRSAFAR